jgi:eukaryotic-like serine/threonine-protein kinase
VTSAFDALFLAFQEAVAGRYSLERELGRGGMGVVYLAREVRLDRLVAIKLLPPELAAHAKLRDRFVREARTAARLSHPYIVPIHAVDEAAEFVFYVMAYVDGETLAQRVTSRGPLSPPDATRILREVAWALAYAHSQGIVHRDIKPANILLERGTGRAMVTDFGIARLAAASGETAVGELLGTPEYMSPEQASGESVDARSDMYSLGIVGYYAVTGSLPFMAPTAHAVLAKQVTQPAPPVASIARATPRSLAYAIDCCLQKDPGHRIQSGEALADALAPEMGNRVDVPVPIRIFIDQRRLGLAIALPAMAMPIGFALAENIARYGATPGKIGALVLLGAIIPLGPLAIVAFRLRPLLKLGYGPDDVAAGLRTRWERYREEFLFDFGTGRSLRERLLGVVTVTGVSVSAASIVAMLAGLKYPWLPPTAVFSAYFGVFAGIGSLRRRRLRLGLGSFWANRWQGAWGRLLTKAASIKLGARSVSADRPTEMAIAISAQALFEELPKETRRALGDLPGAVRNLESEARAMRARVEELEATILEAQSGTDRARTRGRQETLVAELRGARAAAEKRLADVVTALETLRLDLLRLRAGTGSPESITQSLEAAKALGEDVDRLIAGTDEADAAARRSEHSHT